MCARDARRKPAAGLIIARPATGGAFEVLLTRASGSLGGYGFPAGACRDEDGSDAMLARSRGIAPEEARAVAGAHLSPRRALALWLTAIREAFAHTGVLFAISGDAPCPPITAALRSRMFAGYSESAAPISDLLQKENLFCDTLALAYFSRWQTGAAEALFDTRLFLAQLPEGQSPLPEASAATEMAWIAPDRALSSFDRSELSLDFAVYASLRALADFDSLDAALKEFRRGARN